MNVAEIIVVVVICVALVLYLLLYLFHLSRIKKRNAGGEAKPKKEEKASVEENSSTPEQKPVPVGIIKESTLKKKDDEEYDLAPLKEPIKTDKKEEIKKEVKSLSTDMKKVIMSDILKPKF